MLNFFLGQNIKRYLFLLFFLHPATNTAPYWDTDITDFWLSRLPSHKWHFCKTIAATCWRQNHALTLKFKVRTWKRIYQKMRRISWKVLWFFMFLLFSLSQRIFITKNRREKKFTLSQSHTRYCIHVYTYFLISHYWS